MDLKLTDTEVRVLGCLIEKEMATPDYYPLSLNALINACNQKSNREPVVSYDERTVLNALEGLIKKDLGWQSYSGRVSKYSHNFIKTNKFINKEAAIFCVLFLRGPQTAGELRERTERLYRFDSIEEMKDVLLNLEEMGYVKLLPRQAGQKEPRYIHLLSDVPDPLGMEMPGPPPATARMVNAEDDRVAKIEEELKNLRQELEELKQGFLEFKNQF